MRSPFSLPTAGSAATSSSNRHRFNANQTLKHYTLRDAAFRTWREVADALVFPLMWLYAVISYSVFIGEVRPTAGHY
jgi:hypothetical protein